MIEREKENERENDRKRAREREGGREAVVRGMSGDNPAMAQAVARWMPSSHRHQPCRALPATALSTRRTHLISDLFCSA